MDSHILTVNQEQLASLRRKVSKFASNVDRLGLSKKDTVKTDHCHFALKAIYNMPCCHMLLETSEIPISLTARLWHFFPEIQLLTMVNGKVVNNWAHLY